MKTEWGRTKFFSKNEWPDNAADKLDPLLLHELFKLRDNVPEWCIMRPSPLYEAHIRWSSSSRHSIDKGERLSDATDLFLPSWKVAFLVWQAAQEMTFGGIGLYTDTQAYGGPMPMLHLDMRPKRLMWVRSEEHSYVYFSANPQLFLNILSKQR